MSLGVTGDPWAERWTQSVYSHTRVVVKPRKSHSRSSCSSFSVKGTGCRDPSTDRSVTVTVSGVETEGRSGSLGEGEVTEDELALS